MIKNQNMIPEVYYKKSRDFQLFGRLYDVVFNYLKNNTLTIDDLNTNTNPNQNVLELLCQTLGFKIKHDYNNDELSALCSIFLTCMKNKGNQKAISLLLNMICNIQGSESEPSIEYDKDDGEGNVIDIALSVPSNITDFSLIRDVLDYILPSGSIYILTRQTTYKYDNIEDEFGTTDELELNKERILLWNPSSSGIIKLNNDGKVISNNIPLDDTTGEQQPAVDSLDKDNADISSVYSQILTFNYDGNSEDIKAQSDNISKKLNEARTEITTSTNENNEEEGNQ